MKKALLITAGVVGGIVLATSAIAAIAYVKLNKELKNLSFTDLHMCDGDCENCDDDECDCRCDCECDCKA